VFPTTATLFEVHFGCPSAYAEILSANGETQRVSDIASLKNSQLGSAQLVMVFDTSTRVSPEIVLVDTPGLSAPDPRHRQVLTEFLPKADAILLVSDINQQLTRSLANFCRDMKLANKSIYMVLTKCDSKTPDERKAARDYILAQRELGFADVVCVSGVTGEVDELMKVFKEISAKKQEILAKADTARLAQIKQELETTLEEQLTALESIDNCKAALAEEERKLKQLQNAATRPSTISHETHVAPLRLSCNSSFAVWCSNRETTLTDWPLMRSTNAPPSRCNSFALVCNKPSSKPQIARVAKVDCPRRFFKVSTFHK